MHYHTAHRQPVSGHHRDSDAVAAMKVRQSAKIEEFAQTLAVAGSVALDDQARVLGLCRSTAWTITTASHKSSGISAAIINRMLASPNLPHPVRAKILEYAEEKAAGLYGHNWTQRRRFVKGLATKSAAPRQLGKAPPLQPNMDVGTTVAIS